jgi:hypothetical protein
MRWSGFSPGRRRSRPRDARQITRAQILCIRIAKSQLHVRKTDPKIGNEIGDLVRQIDSKHVSAMDPWKLTADSHPEARRT